MKKQIFRFLVVWALLFGLLGVFNLGLSFVYWEWLESSSFTIRLWAVVTLAITIFGFTIDDWDDFIGA
jgi:hypothetical protein